MDCEMVPVRYYVDVQISNQSGTQRFGVMSTLAQAEQLLLTLAGRGDVVNATLVKEASL
jgi:hypothetical protein